MVDVSVVSQNVEDEGDEHEYASTAVIPVIDPFALSATVHVSSVRGGHANISAVLSVPGPRGVVVKGMSVEPAEGVDLLSSSLGAATWPSSES